MPWSHRSHTLPRHPLPISDDVFLFSHHDDQNRKEQADIDIDTPTSSSRTDTLRPSASEPILSSIFVLKGLKVLTESTSTKSKFTSTADNVKIRRRDSLLVTPDQIRARALTLPLPLPPLSDVRTSTARMGVGRGVLPLAPITSQIPNSEGLYLNPNLTFSYTTSHEPRTPLPLRMRVSTNSHSQSSHDSHTTSDSASSSSEAESVFSTPCSSFDDQLSPSTPCPHNTIHDLASRSPNSSLGLGALTYSKEKHQKQIWRSPAPSPSSSEKDELVYPLKEMKSKRRKISKDEYSHVESSPGAGAGLEEPMGKLGWCA